MPTNTEEQDENARTTFEPNVLGWAVTGLSVVIMLLWVRYLYNNGAPKTQ